MYFFDKIIFKKTIKSHLLISAFLFRNFNPEISGFKYLTNAISNSINVVLFIDRNFPLRKQHLHRQVMQHHKRL